MSFAVFCKGSGVNTLYNLKLSRVVGKWIRLCGSPLRFVSCFCRNDKEGQEKRKRVGLIKGGEWG